MGASVVALRNPRLVPNPKSIGIPFHRHQRIVTKAVNRVAGWWRFSRTGCMPSRLNFGAVTNICAMRWRMWTPDTVRSNLFSGSRQTDMDSCATANTNPIIILFFGASCRRKSRIGSNFQFPSIDRIIWSNRKGILWNIMTEISYWRGAESRLTFSSS